MCSYNRTTTWVGPLSTLGDLLKALQARSFRKEVSARKKEQPVIHMMDHTHPLSSLTYILKVVLWAGMHACRSS